MFNRSPMLIDRNRCSLLVIDVQEKLVPAIDRHTRVLWNIRRLIDSAILFRIPVLATEQYPQGLGPTVAPIRERIGDMIEKSMFSCRECFSQFSSRLDPQRKQVVVVGIEAHVCVLQTVMDLLTNGFSVFIPSDAIGARASEDHEMAIHRMRSAGADPVTAESVMFEWCETSVDPKFKSISQLVREKCPE